MRRPTGCSSACPSRCAATSANAEADAGAAPPPARRAPPGTAGAAGSANGRIQAWFDGFLAADTAVFGADAATVCGLAFYPTEKVVFASDCPFDPEKGSMYTRTTIEIVDRLDLSPDERHAIYEGNARRVFPRLDMALKAKGL